MALLAGLLDLLKTRSAESHSTVELVIDDPDAPVVQNYRLATGAVDTPAGAFASGLTNAGEIKSGLDASTDTAEVALDDVACRWTPLLVNRIETLQGAKAKIGRYWRDTNTGQKYHATLMTGVVTGARSDDLTMRLSVISDVYAARSVGANKPIRKKCGLTFKGAACGYTGAETECNKLLNDAGGCSGRSNTFRFGGEDALDPAQTVTEAGALKPPANYTLIKDSAGTTLAMRPALKIIGGSLADDAGNDLTTLTIGAAGSFMGYYFVDDPMYGAVGDGTTNDTTAIQNAIDAAYTAGGGTVYLGQKTYKHTGLVLKDKVRLLGSSLRKSVLYSTTNAKIVSVTTQAFESVVANLTIKGTVGAGSSQAGLELAGSAQYWGTIVRDVWIEDCGGKGFVFGDGTTQGPFSATLDTIHVSNCAGYPFEFNAPIAPCITLRNSYAHTLRSGAGVGFRVKRGLVVLDSCNGIDNAPALSGSHWAVVGRKNGVDGDSTDDGCTLIVRDCNIESFHATGILAYSYSTVSLHGRTAFAGGNSGSQIGVNYDAAGEGSAYYAPYIARGIIEDTVDFADGVAAYANSQPIHCAGFPQIQTVGQGPKTGGGSQLTTYRNTTTSTSEKLSRADGKAAVQVVTGTLTIAWPGVKYIELNHTGTMTLTLPNPLWYARAQEPLIIKDRSASGCATYNATVNAGGGGTVGGSSVTMNKTGQALILMPDGAGDWRVIGNSAGLISGLTSGTIPKASASDALTNSILTEGGGGLTAAGFVHADDLYSSGYSASGGTAPGVYRRRHRGSSGSPAAVQSGDVLGYDVWQGQYDTTAGHRTAGAYVTVSATENWDSTHAGTKVVVSAAPNASTDGFAKKWEFDPSNGAGAFNPGADNTQYLGTSSKRWARVYGNVYFNDGTSQTTAATAPTIYAANVYNSGTQSISNISMSSLNFDTERRDDGSLHSTSSNTDRFTIPATGWYQVSASVQFATNSTGSRLVRFLVNGSTEIARAALAAIATYSTYVPLTIAHYFTVNDYVVVQVFQDSGGTLNVGADTVYSIHKIN